MQRREQPVDGRGLALPLRVIVADTPGGGQHAGHAQQLAGVQHAAVVGAVQRLGHVLHPGEGGAAVQPQPRLGGVRLVQQMLHRRRVRHRPQPQTPRLGLVADGVAGKQLQHRRQLQRFNGFFK